MVDPAAAAEEQARADRLRRTVDVACALLRQGRLSRAEAEALVAETRRRALALFPGKDDVFDLVLAPRFGRILEECCPREPPRTRGMPASAHSEGRTRGKPVAALPEGPEQTRRKVLPFRRRS